VYVCLCTYLCLWGNLDIKIPGFY